jgi:hypothetical protein
MGRGHPATLVILKFWSLQKISLAGPSRVTPTPSHPHRTGDALRRLVDLTSHRSGAVLTLMNDAAVTLPQLLLLSRIEQLGSASLAAIGDDSSVSIPALSQMIDRLVRQGWLDRTEVPLTVAARRSASRRQPATCSVSSRVRGRRILILD